MAGFWKRSFRWDFFIWGLKDEFEGFLGNCEIREKDKKGWFCENLQL